MSRINAQSLDTFNKFVAAATAEKSRAVGPGEDAAIVATMDDENHLLSVGASTTDKAYTWKIRNAAERAANNNAHLVFKEAVEGLFGGADKVPAHIKDMMTKFDGKGNALSARRILLIATEVDIALAGRLGRIQDYVQDYFPNGLAVTMHEVLNAGAKNLSDADFKAIATSIRSMLEEFQSELAALKGKTGYEPPLEFSAQIIQLDTVIGGFISNNPELELTPENRYGKLTAALRDFADSFKAECDAAMTGKAGFKGSRDMSISYSLLNFVKGAVDGLDKTKHLLEVPKLLEKIRTLEGEGIVLSCFADVKNAVDRFKASDPKHHLDDAMKILDPGVVAKFDKLLDVDVDKFKDFRRQLSDTIGKTVDEVVKGYDKRRPEGAGNSVVGISADGCRAIVGELVEKYELQALETLSKNPKAELSVKDATLFKNEVSKLVAEKIREKSKAEIGKVVESFGRKIDEVKAKLDQRIETLKKELDSAVEAHKEIETQMLRNSPDEDRAAADLKAAEKELEELTQLQASYKTGGKANARRIEKEYADKYENFCLHVKNGECESKGFTFFGLLKPSFGAFLDTVVGLASKNVETAERLFEKTRLESGEAKRSSYHESCGDLREARRKLAEAENDRKSLDEYLGGRMSEIEKFAKETGERISSLGEVNVYDVDSCLARLQKTVDGLGELAESCAEGKLGFSGFRDEADKAVELPKPEEISSRIDLNDADELAANMMDNVRLAFQTAARQFGKQDVAKRLMGLVGEAFTKAKGAPQRFFDICRDLAKGVTSIASLRKTVSIRFQGLAREMMRRMESEQCEFSLEDGLPEVTMEESEAVRKAELSDRIIRIGGDGDRGASGFQAQFEDAMDKLIRIGTPEAKQRQNALNDYVLKLSKGDYDSDIAANERFEELYRQKLDAKLDSTKRDDPNGPTLRQRFQAIFDRLETLDLDDPQDVKTFVKICGTFKEVMVPDDFHAIRNEAVNETRAEIQNDPNVSPRDKVLYRLAIGKSINLKLIQAEISQKFGFTEEDFAKIDAAGLERLLRLKKSASFDSNVSAFHTFARELALDPEFPLSYLTESNFDVVCSLISGYADYNDNRDVVGLHQFAIAAGTYSGKEILLSLAQEGLLDIPLPADKEGGEAKVLQFGFGKGKGSEARDVIGTLVYLNGGKISGIATTCRRVFGKEVRDVTRDDLRQIAKTVGDNGKAIERAREAKKKTDVEYFTGIEPYLTMPKETKSVVDVFTGRRPFTPSGWKGVGILQAEAWLNALQGFTKNPGVPVTLNIEGVDCAVSVSENGNLEVRVGPDRTVFRVDAGINALVTSLRNDIIDNHAAYRASAGDGAAERMRVLRGLLPKPEAGKSVGEISGARDVVVAILKKFTGRAASEMAHIPTDKLFQTACDLLAADAVTPEHVRTAVLALDAVPHTGSNSQVVLDAISRLKRTPDADRIVALKYAAEKPLTEEELADKRVHDFVADLVMNENTWVDDACANDADRLKAVLTTHMAFVNELLALDAGGLDARLATVEPEAMRTVVRDLLAAIREKCAGEALTVEKLGTLDNLAALAASVQTGARQALDSIQAFFVDKFVDKFTKLPDVPVGKQTLRELAGAGNIDMNKGYGAFLKEVFSNYFKVGEGEDVSPLKRNILSTFMRMTRSGSSDVDKLRTLVNHSGPVFLKLLQGVPPKALDASVATVLKDVFDNLPDIPATQVQALMLDIVNRSNGEITGIDVIKPIGAASVGEAFLCRIKSKNNPEGVPCVIKLLRPYSQNYSHGELEFMRRQARKVSEEQVRLGVAQAGDGLLKTLEGRFKTILEELDLSIEAENVKRGAIYNPEDSDIDKDVRSMELFDAVPATDMAMVMVKAPGTTCKEFFKNANEQVDAITSRFKRVEGEGEDAVTRYEARNLVDYIDTKNQLREMHNKVSKARDRLRRLVSDWVEQAVYGEGRFFHGDLHLGNIMMGDEVMTLIDFGNASTVTKEEQKILQGMLMQCMAGSRSGFLKRLAELLPDGEKGAYANLSAQLNADLDDAVGRGTLNDLSLRLCAAVNILQSNNVVVPPLVVNFVQCLQRLQNAVEEADSALGRIEGVMNSMTVAAGSGLEEAPLGVNPPEGYSRTREEWLASTSRLGKVFFGGYGRLSGHIGNVPQLYDDVKEDAERSREKEIRDVLVAEIKTLEDYQTKLRPLWELGSKYVNVHLDRESEGSSSYPTDMGENFHDSMFRMPELYKQPETLQQELGFMAKLIDSRLRRTAFSLYNLERFKFKDLDSFAEIVESVAWKHTTEGAAIAELGVFKANAVRKSYGAADAEQGAMQRLNGYVTAFCKRHPELPLEVANEIAKLVKTGVTRLPKNLKLDSEKASGATIDAMKLNLTRLDNLLKTNGIAGRRKRQAALELFAIGFGSMNDLFVKTKTYEQSVFDLFLGRCGDEDVKTVFKYLYDTVEDDIPSNEELNRMKNHEPDPNDFDDYDELIS